MLLFLMVICVSLQAVKHPFITDEPYTGPYVPAPETPRTVTIGITLLL